MDAIRTSASTWSPAGLIKRCQTCVVVQSLFDDVSTTSPQGRDPSFTLSMEPTQFVDATVQIRTMWAWRHSPGAYVERVQGGLCTRRETQEGWGLLCGFFQLIKSAITSKSS